MFLRWKLVDEGTSSVWFYPVFNISALPFFSCCVMMSLLISHDVVLPHLQTYSRLNLLLFCLESI